MLETLLNFEKSLYKYGSTSNYDYLDSLLDENYEEIGIPGKLLNKNDVIDALLSLNEDRKIDIYNFEYHKISNSIYIVHYITLYKDINIYRTSIWKQNNDNYKIIFHQSSVLKDNIELIKY